MKLSGLPQAFHARTWTAAAFLPYVGATLQYFGATRVNFAGNWFVLEEFGDFAPMLEAVDAALAMLGTHGDDLERIFVRNARQLYRLRTRRG